MARLAIHWNATNMDRLKFLLCSNVPEWREGRDAMSIARYPRSKVPKSLALASISLLRAQVLQRSVLGALSQHCSTCR